MPHQFIVLEKDDDLRSLYRRKLEQKFLGCDVFEAASCSEAVERLGHTVVDAIVVNQAALDARGLEMVRSIRRVDTHVPLLSIGDAPMEDAILHSGADLFLESGEWEDLGSAVERVLELRQEQT